MKLFKWIYRPSGNCPVQSEFWLFGKYYYFRARWDNATLSKYDNFEEFNDPNLFFTKGHGICVYTCKAPKAGWLPKWLCYLLIIKGLFMFLFKIGK